MQHPGDAPSVRAARVKFAVAFEPGVSGLARLGELRRRADEIFKSGRSVRDSLEDAVLLAVRELFEGLTDDDRKTRLQAARDLAYVYSRMPAQMLALPPSGAPSRQLSPDEQKERARLALRSDPTIRALLVEEGWSPPTEVIPVMDTEDGTT